MKSLFKDGIFDRKGCSVVGSQILNSLRQRLNVFMEQPDSGVTPKTKKSAHFAGLMAMIYGKVLKRASMLANRIFRLPANRTDVSLTGCHFRIPIRGKSELFELPLPLRQRTLLSLSRMILEPLFAFCAKFLNVPPIIPSCFGSIFVQMLSSSFSLCRSTFLCIFVRHLETLAMIG